MNDNFFGFCILFVIVLILFLISFSFDVRIEKLEVLHNNYDVCVECGNIVKHD